MSKVDVVIGAQWGDEGKGKIVDMISANYDFVCRRYCRCSGILYHLYDENLYAASTEP